MPRGIDPKIIDAVEEYQCPGCVGGGPKATCYLAPSDCLGHACDSHVPGTTILPGGGRIFLGMPKGFNKIGPVDDVWYGKRRPFIFKTLQEKNELWGEYDYYNVPAWKYRNKNGHTLIRVFMPRLNNGELHIILEDCMDRVVGFICPI
jgi:hypothetical protein